LLKFFIARRTGLAANAMDTLKSEPITKDRKLPLGDLHKFG
jgi:hypothetical protein